MAGRGPLPKPDGERQRTNKPTIPTTQLPLAGRTAPPPECPYDLDADGRRWWDWAWTTPQAAGWSDGDAYFVARRASFEDEERTSATAREMREMDDRLGLTPKGLAALRWKIVEEEKPAEAVSTGRRMKLVEKSA